MPGPAFHPSFKAKVIKLDKRYKELQAATRQLRKDTNDFIYATDAVLEQFTHYTDNVELLIRSKKTPKGSMKQQMDLSDNMVAITHRHMPTILRLTDIVASKTGTILAFEALLEASLAQLQQLHTDKEASLAVVTHLEQQLNGFDQTLLELKTALANGHTNLREMQALLKHSVN